MSDDVVVAAARSAPSAAMFVLNPAPFRPIVPELLAAASVLMPNEHEAREMLGGEFEGRDLARLAEGAGAGRAHLVITVGSRGALRVTGQEVSLYPAAEVDAVDTTGAGGAFNGVLAASLSAGASIDEATENAVAAATVATLAVGARAGMPTKAVVEEFVRRSARA